MVITKHTMMAVVALFVCMPALAAQESRSVDEGRQVEEVTQQLKEVELQVRMQEAERRLAEAARQVADLSMAQLPRVGRGRLERIIRTSRGPVLGITIGSDDNNDPVEGVEIQGVSPGGAAEAAGLRAGDVIVSINEELLTAEDSQDANAKLLDFMQGVEAGDTLDIDYLRNGKSDSTEITPRPMGNNVFSFGFDGGNFLAPDMPVAPDAPHFRSFVWATSSDGFGEMELVKLTERLGSYFGTDDGLLVVRAPEDEKLQLQDGDVILNIDGRKPTSVAHAMRILGSYESGEELKIEIMRDRRKRNITLEIPDNENRQSSSWPTWAPGVQSVPKAKIVVIEQERI